MSRMLFVIAMVIGCGGGQRPKPPELVTLETLRQSREAAAASKLSPEFVGEADVLQKRATSAWKDKEMEVSKRHALNGWIKLKMAIAQWDQAEAKRRIKAADAVRTKYEAEIAKVGKELATLEEQVSLLEKLANAKSSAEVAKLTAEQEKQKLAAELAQQQQRGDAQNKLIAAELALKTADTVEAKTHAEPEYQAAADLIARAQLELKEGKIAAAATSATLAAEKAEQAASLARPKYANASEATDRKLRDEALGTDAAALAGITVSIKKQGETTRLILTYGGAFKPKQTNISGGKESVLDGVAALLKKYPTYPVQVVGHTDTAGRADALLVISQARAQVVYDALVTRGVNAKRFVVSGVGGGQPLGENRTAKGRAKNNRVELILLYQ
jgi:outer membrane protein OmpA-like peptidoglycan-associated protein